MNAAKKNVVGVEVRRLRTAAGRTQDQLAAGLQLLGWDLARGTLAKIESGVRRVNDAELVLLAGALEVDPGALLGKVRVRNALRIVRQGGDG